MGIIVYWDTKAHNDDKQQKNMLQMNCNMATLPIQEALHENSLSKLSQAFLIKNAGQMSFSKRSLKILKLSTSSSQISSHKISKTTQSQSMPLRL
jgi:hypothetical protein